MIGPTFLLREYCRWVYINQRVSIFPLSGRDGAISQPKLIILCRLQLFMDANDIFMYQSAEPPSIQICPYIFLRILDYKYV